MLKTGRWVTLRAMIPRDVDEVLALERDIVAAGEGVVMTEDDFKDAAALRRNLVTACYRPLYSGVRMVARGEDGVAGTSAIQRLRPGLCRHVATLSAGVAPAYQGIGLGTLLVRRALDWVAEGGRDAPPVSRVELSVRADNPRAIALYERAGFAIEARRRGYVRTPDGRLIDDLIMVRSGHVDPADHA